MDAFSILWLIPVIPLLGAAINGVFGKRLPKTVTAIIGSGAVGLSFLIAVREFLAMIGTEQLPIVRNYFTWIQSGVF